MSLLVKVISYNYNQHRKIKWEYFQINILTNGLKSVCIQAKNVQFCACL